MMPFRALVGAALVVLFAGAPAPGQPGEAGSRPGGSAPPLRKLTGEDANRVNTLSRTISALEQSGRFDEAQGPAREVQEIRRRVQGPRHWETRDAERKVRELKELAALPEAARVDLAAAGGYAREASHLAVSGHPADAEGLYRQALEIRRRVLGDDYPETARIYDRVGFALWSQGKPAQGEPPFRQALEIRRRVLGDDHPDTARSCNNLAFALKDQGNSAAAEPLLKQALEIRVRTLGENDPATALSAASLAALLGAQGKYAEAEEQFQRALEIQLQSRGPDHPETAATRNDLGHLLWSQGKHAAAEPQFRQALEVRQRILSEDHSDTVISYNNLAASLGGQGQYAEAERLDRTALAIQRRIRGENHPDTARTYYILAVVLSDQEKNAEAEPPARQAREISLRTQGENHSDTVRSSTLLASVLAALARYDEAESLYRNVLEVRGRAAWADERGTAGIMNDLGHLLWSQGKHAAAEPLFRQAVEIRQRVLGEDHPETIISSGNLATVLRDQGKSAEAQRLRRKLLEIRLRLVAADRPDSKSAESYGSLASVLSDQGLYAEAEELYRKALAIELRIHGEDHVETARSSNSLGHLLWLQGRYAEAEPLFRQALEVWLRVRGDDHVDTINGYNNLAADLTDGGNPAAAEPLFRKALELRLRLLGENHPRTAESINNLAHLLSSQGKLAAAEPLARQALAITLQVRGADHPFTATCYSNLGAILSDQRKLVEAEAPHREALDIRLRVLGADHPDTAASYNSLASLLYAQGQDAEAEALALLALRSFETARRSVSHTGLERARFTTMRSPSGLLAALLARRGQAEAAWQRLEAGLARGLFEEVARPLEPEERRREQEVMSRLQRLDEQLAALSLTAATAAKADEPRQKQEEMLRRRRGEVHSELVAFQAEIERKYGAAAGHAYDLAQVQSQLPKDAALVAWLGLRRASATAAETLGDDHWACIVRSRGAPTWVKLPGSGPGRSWTHEDHQRLAQVSSAFRSRPEGPPRDWKAGASALTVQRLDPLDAHLGPRDGMPVARHLVILTSPMMAGIPVEALLEARPPGRPRYAVSYAPSATMLAWLRERPGKGRETQDGPRSLLALGDPLFESSEPARPVNLVLDSRPAAELLSSRRGPPAPLPGTRREVEAIARLFDRPGVERPEVLLGPDASEARLDSLAGSDRLRHFDILHLATHGVLNPRASMHSALLLATVTRSNALDRALKGEPVYDGELTAEQILRTWKLDADLVTLSACETGLGQQSGGEGYLGFSQALFLAGARSLVLSLWKVDDTATSLLMTRFYENLLGRRAGLNRPLPRAEALGEAKRWLRGLTADQAEAAIDGLERGKIRPIVPTPVRPDGPSAPGVSPAPRRFEHPYYWAAFILVGDPW